MIDLDNFPERLEFVFNHFELSASALADRLEVQRSSISHLLAGRNKPSLEFIAKLMEAFPELRFEWLVYGQEPKLKNAVVEQKIYTKETESVKAKEELYDQSPSLFDQMEDQNIQEEKKEEKKEEEPDKEKTLAEEPQMPQHSDSSTKVLSRIILIYADGSFETFKN